MDQYPTLSRVEQVDANTNIADVYTSPYELPAVTAWYGPYEQGTFHADPEERNAPILYATTDRPNAPADPDIFNSAAAWDARVNTIDSRLAVFENASTGEQWIAYYGAPRTARDQLWEIIEDNPNESVADFAKRPELKKYRSILTSYPDALAASVLFTSHHLRPADGETSIATAAKKPSDLGLFPAITFPEHSVSQINAVARMHVQSTETEAVHPFYTKSHSKFLVNDFRPDSTGDNFSVFRNTADFSKSAVIPIMGGPVDSSYLIYKDPADRVENAPLTVPLKTEHLYENNPRNFNFDLDPAYARDFYRVATWKIDNHVYEHPQGFNDAYMTNLRSDEKRLNKITHDAGVSANSTLVQLEPIVYVIGTPNVQPTLEKRFQLASVPYGYNEYERLQNGFPNNGERVVINPDDNTRYRYSLKHLKQEEFAPGVVHAMLSSEFVGKPTDVDDTHATFTLAQLRCINNEVHKNRTEEE